MSFFISCCESFHVGGRPLSGQTCIQDNKIMLVSVEKCFEGGAGRSSACGKARFDWIGVDLPASTVRYSRQEPMHSSGEAPRNLEGKEKNNNNNTVINTSTIIRIE